MSLALAILGATLCLTHCGPARASDASDALAALCPARHAIAPAVEAAAVEARVDPVVLIAMARVESSCDPSAVNRRTGALGWLQVMPGRSADPDHLEAEELLTPGVNAMLGARHLRKCIDLCGSLVAGLHVYHGGKHCRDWRGDRYVKRVLELVARAKRAIAKMREGRS